MKKIYYQLDVEISPQVFLHYNAFSNQFLLLNKEKHDIFLNYNCVEIENGFPSFYQKLMDAYFIVPDDFDELEVVKDIRRQMQYDAGKR